MRNLTGLSRRLLRVCSECGALKYNVLRALAVHHGYTEDDLKACLKRLRAGRLLKLKQRRGGAHYAIATARGTA